MRAGGVEAECCPDSRLETYHIFRPDTVTPIAGIKYIVCRSNIIAVDGRLKKNIISGALIFSDM